MKLIQVNFRRDIRLRGNTFLPKTIALDTKEDARDWELQFDPFFRTIEVTVKTERMPLGALRDQTFAIPLESADSWRYEPEELAAFRSSVRKASK